MGAGASSPSIDVSQLLREPDADEGSIDAFLPEEAIPLLDILEHLTPDAVRELLTARPRNLARLVLKVRAGRARHIGGLSSRLTLSPSVAPTLSRFIVLAVRRCPR
jgi:hypothetical protein